jgi:lipid A ethanolaminephosphotransferase
MPINMLKKLSSRRLVVINGLLALWMTCLANTYFLHQLYTLTPYNGFKAAVFLASAFILLWAYLNLLLQLITWGFLARPLKSLLLFFCAFGAYSVDTFGIGVDAGQVQNLMQTDLYEARDLLSWRLLGYIIIIMLVPLYWLWRKPLESQSFFTQLKERVYGVVLSMTLIGSIAMLFYVDYAAIFREHRTVRFTVNPTNSINAFTNYFQRHVTIKKLPLVRYGEDAKRHQIPQGKPTLMVLVVGETARAESFSLNGYTRNTNPELSQKPLINFSQASSCGTATAVSLPCMFSGFTRRNYDDELANHREGLLDVLQRAGYHVTWIDNNSGCKGACDRVTTIPLLPHRTEVWCKNGECQDDILLETFNDYLKNAPVTDRVIVLHQEGSHGPAYYRRYPKNFEKFTPVCNTNAIQGCSQEALINTYDNTILYTDYILAQTINTLINDAKDYQSALWYVSDHGESTGERGLYLHGTPYIFAPSQQTHIPMFTWLSPNFAFTHAQATQCLKQKRSAPVSHDNLFHTMLGLLGVTTSVYERDLDLSWCK